MELLSSIANFFDVSVGQVCKIILAHNLQKKKKK